MSTEEGIKMEEGLAELMPEAQAIYNQLKEPDESGLGAAAFGLEGRIKKWVERARKLADEVHAESVSITGGFPAGLSVTVTLKLGSG